MSDDFFALPPFKPAEVLQLLKRSLRDLRSLAAGEQQIDARLAKRPMRGGTPEWDAFKLAGSPDVRKFTDEVKRRLARWTEEDR